MPCRPVRALSSPMQCADPARMNDGRAHPLSRITRLCWKVNKANVGVCQRIQQVQPTCCTKQWAKAWLGTAARRARLFVHRQTVVQNPSWVCTSTVALTRNRRAPSPPAGSLDSVPWLRLGGLRTEPGVTESAVTPNRRAESAGRLPAPPRSAPPPARREAG